MKFIRIPFIILFFFSLTVTSFGQQKDFLVMLNGVWKFQIGDSSNWKESEYNDTQWETINVPSAWEDQGFYGLNGFAWYRKEFVLPKEFKNKELYVSLGYIDDIDQVFVNGKLIGFAGVFPPHFSTALDVPRKYPIPFEFLNLQGKNVISVRVFDQHMSGGILSGNIGIYTERTFQTDIPLTGIWRFRAGDNLSWKEKGHNDKSWNNMVVPGNWKNHGYKDYNGICWYRTVINIPEEFENQKMVLVIGKIDNCDELYMNGELIGKTGVLPQGKKKQTAKSNSIVEQEPEITDDCSKMRAYILPDNYFENNKTVVIAVRIFNNNYRGGIVEGPIGFIRLSTLTKLQKDKQYILDNN